jgi:copper(I)-binding protein
MKPACLIAAAFLALWASAAAAETSTNGSIVVGHPWMRATPKGASSAAAYFTVTNNGTSADRLLGGSSPIASRFEIHQMSMTNGIMRMRPLKDGLEIKPGETVELKPDASHAMLSGLKQQLKQGDHVVATLNFEKAGAVEIECAVESLGAQQPSASGMDHMHMH